MQPSEKRLLLILCAALFLALNLFGLRALTTSRKRLAGEISSAKSTLAEDRSWIDLGDTLRSSDDWIASHPMPELAPDDASAQLLKAERDAAEGAGLKVTEENLIPPGQTSHCSTVGVAVKITGPFAGVVKFLFSLQTPTAWRVVSKLALRSDTEPPNVVADLEILQLFQPSATHKTP